MREKTGLTRTLARQAVSLRHQDIPEDIRALAVQGVLDTVGCAIAGWSDPLAGILAADLAQEGSGSADIIGSTLRLPPLSAALLNGTVAHALDYDDVNMSMPGHPSAAILPALLALAETRNSAGADIVTAYVAGYELACRVARAVQPAHYDGIGFHSTGTLCTFGAAAACGHLLGLDEERMLHALGIAATTAAGLKSMFGTMCKPLHAGRAAQAGLQAARLATAGFTSRPDSIECPQGFAATHAGILNEEAALETPPGGWHFRNNLFKYHAACYLTHAGIECGRKLRDRGIPPENIAAITLKVDRTLDRICNIAEPRTGLEAKFSLRLTTAMALAGTDTAKLGTYGDAAVNDPTLIALRDRVVLDFQQGWSQTQAALDIRLTDQTTLSATHDSGLPAADIAEQGHRLAAKFTSLTAPVMGEARAETLRSAIARFETAGNINAISAAWRLPAEVPHAA